VGAGAGTLFFMIKHLNLIGFGKREINSVATIMHTWTCLFCFSQMLLSLFMIFFYAHVKTTIPIHSQVIWEFFNCYMLISDEATSQLLLRSLCCICSKQLVLPIILL
jgi:hypothetical protein